MRGKGHLMALTPKQEKFAQEVASGKTQADAYRAAYSNNMKPETIIQAASRMMANSNVNARVDELKKELAEKQLWTREMSVEVLRQIALDAEATNGEKTAATKELNVMHGYNAPTQVNVTTKALPATVDDFFM